MNTKTEIQNAVVLVNLAAGGGRWRKAWLQLIPEIMRRLPADTIVIPFDGQINLMDQLPPLIQQEGVNCFISAGGDGSVHYLLNALMQIRPSETTSFFLGAVGLGSSNDFHKPFGTKIGKVAVRINGMDSTLADVGQVDFLTESGNRHRCYFLINASLGVTASANHFFNHGDPLIRFLKSKWTDAAIMYAAVKTIFTYRNFKATLRFNQGVHPITISNLAVLKNPHISGNLRFDQVITPDDGKLGLNYCDNMNKLELIQTLNDLGKGRFSGREKRYSHFINSLSVEVDHPVPLEADGEIYLGKDFEFSLLPKAINLLGNGN